MSEYIIPTESLICFRRGGPRRHTEPLTRASMATVKGQDTGLAGRDFVLLGCTAFLLGVMGLMYLLQASAITGISYRVHLVRNELRRLEQESSVLAVEIAQLERLDRVERDAEALGLTHDSSLHYLQLGGLDAVLAQEPSSGE